MVHHYWSTPGVLCGWQVNVDLMGVNLRMCRIGVVLQSGGMYDENEQVVGAIAFLPKVGDTQCPMRTSPSHTPHHPRPSKPHGLDRAWVQGHDPHHP